MTPPDRDCPREPAGVRLAACALCALALLVHPGSPRAADDDARIDDVRMQVVGDPDADEAEYVDQIELPEAAATRGESASRPGRERAGEARDRARGGGRETASDARELGGDARRTADERPDGQSGQRPDSGSGNRP